MSTSALKSGFALMPMWNSVFIASQWFPNEMDSGTESFSHGATPVLNALSWRRQKKNRKRTVCSWCSHKPFCRLKQRLSTSVESPAGVSNSTETKQSFHEPVQYSGDQINLNISLVVESNQKIQEKLSPPKIILKVMVAQDWHPNISTSLSILWLHPYSSWR